MNKALNTILKYKLLHIGYWLISISVFLHYREERFGGGYLADIVTTVIVFGGKMLSVYFIIYNLIPRFLEKKKYLVFILSCIACMLLSSFLSSTAYVLFKSWVSATEFLIMTVGQFVDMIMDVVVFVLAVTIYERYHEDQNNRKLEKERLETELNFLKAQMNPHFLFNALNSIYVLISMDKNAAEQSLMRFSGMLRYQLYECSEKTEIEKELNFLNDYIGLETLRKENNLKVNYKYPQEIPYRLIAPFLLIPFVENAFKHVSRGSEQNNSIDINASFRKNDFVFSVFNTTGNNSAGGENNGIGLRNVQRRLELLYPGKHRLEIMNDFNVFSVTLELYA